MQLKRKLPWILSGKSLLAVGSIAMVALALVTYSATVTINFSAFFRQGVTSTTWAMTTSSGLRYMPGNTTVPLGTGVTLGSPSTFAFYSQNSQGFIKVNLATVAPTTDFKTFSIYVLTLNGTTWNNATMYISSAGGAINAMPAGTGINATGTTCPSVTNCNVGYIRVNNIPTTLFYAIEVSYSLVAAPVDSTISTVFQYTPSLN